MLARSHLLTAEPLHEPLGIHAESLLVCLLHGEMTGLKGGWFTAANFYQFLLSNGLSLDTICQWLRNDRTQTESE